MYFVYAVNFLLTVAIVNASKEHTGHDVSNPDHLKVNRPNPALVDYINICFSSGMTNTEAMMAGAQWSSERGAKDVADRRFYLTPNDVKYLREAFVRYCLDSTPINEIWCVLYFNQENLISEPSIMMAMMQ
jgi:hypothetical protein